MEKFIKLNIGCGDDIRIGWRNTDKEDGDLYDMRFEKESVDAILLSHVAMYIRPDAMLMLARKWHSWLKPGGTVHIETGNLKSICVLGEKQRNLYGMGKHAGHKWAWLPEELAEIMKLAGFNNITFMPGILHGKPERDFLLCAMK